MNTEGPPSAADGHRGPRKRWPRRQHQLLDELERIFRTEGFAHLSVGAMAARLRVSRSTLYRLAPAKERLIELVIARMFRRHAEDAEAVLESAGTLMDKVTVCLRSGTVPCGSPAFTSDVESFPAARAIRDEYLASGRKVLAELIDDGAKAGAFRPVSATLAAQMTDAAQARIRDPAILKETGMTREQAADGLTGILLHGIGGDGPRRAVRLPTG